MLSGVTARVLVINPRSDDAFADTVHALADTGDLSAAELQRSLRATYPLATVREREISGELWSTWYVYREGMWVPNESR